MNLKPSTALRNEYPQISKMARASGQPIIIANKGKADGVFMSIEAFEEREKMLEHRASVLEAEFARLAGAETYSTEEIRRRLKEKYDHA